jgi:hypothetical protein
MAAADVATVALPDASTACAGTSAARAASSVDRPAAGASAPTPGARSSAASAALGEGGAGSCLSGGSRPPSLSSSSSPDDESSEVAGGERPCCSRSRNSSSLCSQHSRRRILFSFLRVARSCSRRYAPRAHSGSGRRRVGPRGVHDYPLLGRVKCQNHKGVSRGNEGERGRTHSPGGVRKHNEQPEVVVSMLDGLEGDGLPRPRGHVLPRKALE